MSTSLALDGLRTRILSGYSLMFLHTWEEQRWEEALSELAMEMERGLVVWTATTGPLPQVGGGGQSGTDPLEFLNQLTAYPPDHLFLLKDFHPFLADPRVVRKLRDLIQTLPVENKTLLLLGPQGDIPVELQKDAVAVELPLPGLEELQDDLVDVLAQRSSQPPLEATTAEKEKLLTAVLGLTSAEARKALARALHGREAIDDEVFAMLVAEKGQMVQGSDLLEFYDLDQGVDDIGGLGGLKDWLKKRADAFSPRAQEQGIPAPKGVLLLGVQGCGKSLTARATARLLSFPLVRMDAANLLSGEQGGSEKNMRSVLTLMETIAPAVLWMDEVEKGFAGADGGGQQDATMSRLVGQFLTWMEDRKAPVFVVATANSVSNLPPEMLRRGRFDELFFVDLPNYHERIDIFRIHLTRRGWKPEKYDLEELANRTEGYSGAEIEQIVIAAMLESYSRGGVLSQEALLEAKEQSVPLSVTMEERIFELREWARERCRPATYDSRVMQMLDQEHRQGALASDDFDEVPEWQQLAEHGQSTAAIVEYIRSHDRVPFPQLQQDFAEFMETEGEQGLALRSDPNIVLWVGMSRELAEILAKMINNRRLYLHPTEAEQYGEAAASLRLPQLEELPEERISRPGWYPTCLRDLPQSGGSGRFARVARIGLKR